jgi:hypothetical protein
MKTSFSTSEIGPDKFTATTAPVQQRVDLRVSEGLEKFKRNNRAYRRADREGDTQEKNRLVTEEAARLRKDFEASEAAVSGGGGNTRNPRGGTMPPPPAGFNRD